MSKMMGWDLVLMDRWRWLMANCGSWMVAFHSLETHMKLTKSLGERRVTMSISSSARRHGMLNFFCREVGFAVCECTVTAG